MNEGVSPATNRFGAAFRTVEDHDTVHAGTVQIEDVSSLHSELAEELNEEPDASNVD
jgi:hypothetical protein